MKCEQYIVVSWYQRRCEREAKYQIQKLHLMGSSGKPKWKLGKVMNVCLTHAQPVIKMLEHIADGVYDNFANPIPDGCPKIKPV